MTSFRTQCLVREHRHEIHDLAADDSEEKVYHENERKPAEFKNYNDRLIACNGDCGSSLSKFIDTIVHHKVCDYVFIQIIVDVVILFETRTTHKSLIFILLRMLFGVMEVL